MKSLTNPLIAVVLSFFAAVLLAQRIHTFQEPLECDTALFSVLAQEWRHGRVLYSELWDNKPPGIILTFAAAQAIAGEGPRSILLLGVGASILTLLALYAGAFWMTGDRRAGLWSAFFWTLINASPHLEANQPLGEVFVNACWAWGAAFIFRSALKDSASRDLWVGGCLLAAASFYKHHVALTLGLLVISCIFAQKIPLKRWKAAFSSTIFPLLTPTVVLWFGLFSYFIITRRGQIFWDTFVTYSRFYSAHRFFPAEVPRDILFVLIPLAALALLGICLAFTHKKLQWIVAVGYAAMAWAGFVLPGRFYPHYYQLLLPPLALLAGAATSLLRPHPGIWPAAVAVALMLTQLPMYTLGSEEWSRRKYGEVYITIKKMGQEIDRNLPPEKSFYELGYEPGLYYYSGRRPPTGILLADHWEEGPLQNQFTHRILQDLQRSPPELLVTTVFWLGVESHKRLPLTQWGIKHYRPFPRHAQKGPFLLFARIGSALEMTLAKEASSATR